MGWIENLRKTSGLDWIQKAKKGMNGKQYLQRITSDNG